jgi:hypothetical protein
MDHAARGEPLVEARELSGRRPVRQLRLLLGVQVVQVAEELIEPMGRRQVLVQVTQMVLAELPRSLQERIQKLGDGRVPGLQSDIDSWHTYLAQSGAVYALPGDEGGAASRAALLPVGIG